MAKWLATGPFTQVLASLVDKGLVKVHRISQDGTRVRACAGASSFRGDERLNELLNEARAHVDELSCRSSPIRSNRRSCRPSKKRPGVVRQEERAERIEAAIAQLPGAKREPTKGRRAGG